jgi:Tat protein translocase TatC
MARSTGEMPFLDHLEELRSRILKSLLALIVAIGAGIWLVERLRLVDVLKAPITPFLPTGRLVVQSPTEPIMIVLKLGLVVGLVLASPVLVWQAWAFLSPALYAREKKAIVPALFAGLGLFVAGSVLSFVYVVPQALRVLLSFQAGSFETLITFEKYYGFVLQVVLAMGLSAELPLLIILLALLGVATPARLGRFRRYAVVCAFAAGALLSPGADVFSMMLMTAPLIILYEIGYVGAVIVHRRRLRAAAATAALAVLALWPAPARGQQPPARPPARRLGVDTLADTLRGRPVDTASARRLGLPTAPSLSFPPGDSIIADLVGRSGYQVTRYMADTARMIASSRDLELEGRAMTEREGATLEAGRISYREGACRFDAQRDPRLFQQATVVVGEGVTYDTCVQRGVVSEGLTTFAQQGANWIVRGSFAVDSASRRMYATAKEVTSCDLPDSHYHFAARELKWVSQSVMVARPAVLYVRDVPVAWVPFLFQDTKRGRRSGILIPEFGFNDIVRPSRNYNRTIRNLGYYWAVSEYLDVLARFDWFANRYIEFGVEGQYRWIDRFMRGAVSFARSKEIGGSTNTRIVWNHNQTFNATTKLNVSLDYVTNSSIIRRNSIDPRLTTQQIRSSANLTKQFRWGNLALGGTRTQDVNDNSGRQTFPTLTLSPKPFDLTPSITWSPDLNFTNETAFRQPLPALLVAREGAPGRVDTLKLTGSSRVSRFSLNTPLRVGGFQWQNSVSLVDADSTGVREDQVRIPDEDTPDPADSITIRRVRGGGFGSEFDWQTGINLPVFFRTSWKVTPTVGITNTTAGPFAVRNDRTGGRFVTQGKRLQFGVSAAPTLYGFLPGVGPLERIRHTVQPSVSFSYSPAASVPIDYARAVAAPGQPLRLRSDPTQTLTLSLTQNFEAKTRRPAGDTTDLNVRKLRLLSINTSGLTYDFEQAKQPGRTGWATASITNSMLSDLVPGFTFSVTHDLWDGPVGTDSARFSPFLSGVSAAFSLSPSTFRAIGRLLGVVAADAGPGQPQGPTPGPPVPNPFSPPPGDLRRGTGFTTNQYFQRGARGFNAAVNYTLSRQRPTPAQPDPPTQSNISLNTGFAPTRLWQVNWTTQYNGAEKRFEAHQLSLVRDLHDWRATFSFTRAPNGNFAFSFLITLIDLPDIRFDYRQTTIQP